MIWNIFWFVSWNNAYWKENGTQTIFKTTTDRKYLGLAKNISNNILQNSYLITKFHVDNFLFKAQTEKGCLVLVCNEGHYNKICRECIFAKVKRRLNLKAMVWDTMVQIGCTQVNPKWW